MWRHLAQSSPYCTPMACHESIARANYSNDRYVFGYARDNSIFPLLLLHPVRRQHESFTLVDFFTAATLPLATTPEVRILPVDHFYDAFRAVPMMSLRTAVIEKFGLNPEVLTPDLRISKKTAVAVCRPDVRDLLPGATDVVSDGDSDQGSPRKTLRDIRDEGGDTAMSNGSWSSSEDTSAEESGTDNEEQDQELFLEAYTSFRQKSGAFGSNRTLQGLFEGVESLPDSWPMARLSLSFDGLVFQVEKVAVTAAMEIIASHVNPDDCLPALTQLAKDITVALSLYLADLVAGFLTGRLFCYLVTVRVLRFGATPSLVLGSTHL